MRRGKQTVLRDKKTFCAVLASLVKACYVVKFRQIHEICGLFWFLAAIMILMGAAIFLYGGFSIMAAVAIFVETVKLLENLSPPT